MGSTPTVEDVRKLAMSLPRTEEHLIHGRVKFRIRSIVYVALSRDGQIMGFAFPKELRDALIAGEPDKFLLPSASDLRFNWVCVRLQAIDKRELRALVTEAWRMVVPQRLAAAHLQAAAERAPARPRRARPQRTKAR